MRQHEAVIKVMEENGGYATFPHLYQNVLKIKDCDWKTKTPFASIRRIVQDERFFFKIRPGLWALKTYKDKLPAEILMREGTPPKKQIEYSHTFYQGLLVELGNMRSYYTFVSNQDKNKSYLNKKLGEIATVNEIFMFGYEHFVRKAQAIDVVWFNERKMPAKFFEVEHITGFERSFIKFAELQDFYAEFYVVADEKRKWEFESKLNQAIFSSIKKRLNFIGYERLAERHSKEYELYLIKHQVGF